ncbi:MAG: Choice-of-anchor family protein, partial [Bacteroidetes bacterium]|nr:Choice-of-anchor family protein [Bacteroidota bacterium]
MLGHLNQNHGTTQGVSFAGCWGYVAPDGREYAILGTATGCAVIDITNGASPVEIGHIVGATSLWKEVKAYDHYAYVVSDVNGNQGLQIINLSNLPNSVSLDTTIMSLGGFSVAQSHTISIHDGYLYLNGTGSGMIIASLANPRRPQYLGRWTTRYVHDCYVRNDTIFAAAINNGRLDIINGRIKSNPTLIASIAYTGGGTHNVWTTKDRRYAVTTDEIGSTLKNLKVWNLQNLPTVSNIPDAQFSAVPTDIVHNVFIRGDYAYVAWYTAGFRVVNLTNPTNPGDAGGYDTSTEPPGSYDGMWACYPYFPSGKIIGSDMQNGLWVFRFSDLQPRQPVTLLQPANGSTVNSTDSIRFRWTRAASMSSDPHYYKVRLYGVGIDSTFRANDTTMLLTNLSALVNGQTYRWRVYTCDEFNTVASQDSFQFTYSSLPIVLAFFTATQNGSRVQLAWRTLSEFNNLGFEIERAFTVPARWTTLSGSFRPGFGTTTVPHDYLVIDSIIS